MSEPKVPALERLIEQWRARAIQAQQWACDHERDNDGWNAHAFRKERRIWTTCADELEKLLAAALPPPPEEADAKK